VTDLFTRVTGNASTQLEPERVDEVLLAGAAGDVRLHLGAPVSRGELGRLVAERRRALADAGLRRGGSVAPCLPPSLAFITNLLASWQIGARASLLDHRLTAFEVDVALRRLAPQVVVTARSSAGGGPLRRPPRATPSSSSAPARRDARSRPHLP
jgi:acyl-coenzyme A synthetase/AMP-(fatty) acid ligase